MFAILCRRRSRVLPKGCIFIAQLFGGGAQNAVLVRSCSSSVCKNDSEKSFTVSYLIDSCGLSTKEAISASEKFCFKSLEKPDAVLKLLREYGFVDAHIHKMVARWPQVLATCPSKNLAPKLEFFRSIGVPLPVLAHKLSANPCVLMCSLENSLIPKYNDLKSLLQSDERVFCAFSHDPWIFCRSWSEWISSNTSMLRERGLPESSIVSLAMNQPSVLIVSKEKLAVYVDRAVEMGFDISKRVFVQAIRVFDDMSESTLKHKMEVYRRCGWSDSDIIDAFLRHPFCLKSSEEKIMANMDFLFRELGYKPVDVARCPMVLSYSLDKRIKPRCLVAKILNEKGLKKMGSVSTTTLLKLPEQRFLEGYIIKYQKDIPELLDIYRGNLSPGQVSNISN